MSELRKPWELGSAGEAGTVPSPPQTTDFDPTPAAPARLSANLLPPEYESEDFFDYWVEMEGTRKNKEGLHIPYNDQGHKAQGHGHRKVPGENYPKAWTDEQAKAVFALDVAKHRPLLSHEWNKRYPKNPYAGLDANQKSMLMDFAMNQGVKGFFHGGKAAYPKFIKAVHDGDYPGMAEEYERYSEEEKTGKMKLDKRRNDAYYAKFIEPRLPDPIRDADRLFDATVPLAQPSEVAADEPAIIPPNSKPRKWEF